MPKKIIIRKSPTPQPQQYRASPSPYAPQPNQESHGTLCFWLGAIFGPFGLLLAAIVGKAAGLIKALRGFFSSAFRSRFSSGGDSPASPPISGANGGEARTATPASALSALSAPLREIKPGK